MLLNSNGQLWKDIFIHFRACQVKLFMCIISACAAIGERCANGRCLWPRERCDGVNNCGDYSDETNCSTFML